MTMQICFSTPEGALLASDLKNVNLGGFRFGRITPKIEVHKSDNFAHCSAGDDFCRIFTETVREKIQKNALQFVRGEVIDALTECVYMARKKESTYVKKHSSRSGGLGPRRSMPTCVGGTTMLVFRGEGSVTLWTVDTSKVVPIVMPVPMGASAWGGDTNNPSIFFPHWYFNKIPNSLASMVPLAVHTVLMAKSDNVEGIQVGVFTKNRFGMLTSEELKPYIELSERIESDILKSLLTTFDLAGEANNLDAGRP